MRPVRRPRRTALLALATVLALCALAVLLRSGRTGAEAHPPVPEGEYTRIASLAPSITEVLFAVGMGDRVAGVTRFCLHPPAATAKPKIGGYFDPNYEAIIALDPDLVILLDTHTQVRDHLAALDKTVMAVDHQSIDGILDSIERIAEAGGRGEAGAALAADIRRRMAAIAERTGGRARPRVLVSAGRTLGSGSLEQIYIAGKGNFYTQLVELAGGTNAYEGGISFPSVSAEGVIHMNPDVIVEMVGNTEVQGLSPEAIAAEWQVLRHVNAVTNGQIHVFTEDYAVIPGPRFILTLEKLARALHPGVAWETEG